MKRIIAIFIVWRAMLFIVAGISPFILNSNFGNSFPYFQERLMDSKLPHFIWSFGNFDGVHYLGIAQNGYRAQFTQVFFPFYPLVVKITATPLNIIFSEKQNLLISGLIISNTSFLLVLILFYRLVKKNFNENCALWSVLFLTFFPTSFFFGSIYTESLFLLMVISAFYLSEKKLLLASIIASFSSFTRLTGIFLAPTLSFRKKLPYFIVPCGLLIYVIYLQIMFKDPLYFISGQSAFGNERNTNSLILFPQVLFRYLKILMTTQGKELFVAVFELLSTLGTLTLLFFSLGVNKIKKEWIIFSLLSVLLPTLTGTLSSMPRYVLVAFPIYIYLALIKSNFIKISIFIFFLSLLTLLTALFSQGYWVA